MQQPPDPNFQQIPNQSFQQYPNQNMQSLPNQNMQSLPNQNMQSLPNQNMQSLPNQNMQSLPNQNMQSLPNQGIQLKPQNSTFSHFPTNPERPTQGFPVIYDNFTFIVDPISLSNSSQKFKELIDPYINDFVQMKEIHLSVLGNQFSKRNMRNFLRICQKLPTDVQNSEMKEICEIAKMFKSEEIYNKGLVFIQANQDPNFFVPDNKYDGSDGKSYLVIEGETNVIDHDPDLDDGYFEDADNEQYQGNYYKINTNTTNVQNSNQINETQNNQQPNLESHETQNNQQPNLESHEMLHDPESNLNKAFENDNENNSNVGNQNIQQNVEDQKDESSGQTQKKGNQHSAVYQVRFENHTIKCPIFKFVHDNTILYTAKQKYYELFIAKGAEIHIRDHKSHVCYILQNETFQRNKVVIGDTKFDVNYVKSNNINHYSLEVTFPFNGKVYSWAPRPPRFDPNTGKYYLNFHGEYHHTPIPSSKNILLQNKDKKPTFIVRKMSQNIYEIECSPALDPLIAFSIGLSDIVGPYLDPWIIDGMDLL